MNIKQIRIQTGLSQSKFASLFQIPVATLKDWEQERRNPPAYVVDMIKNILESNGMIGSCEKYSGNSICGGISFGEIYVFNNEKSIANYVKEDYDISTFEAYRKAKVIVKEQMEELFQKATKQAGKEYAEIFKSYQMILSDPEYDNFVYNLMENENVDAECAVTKAEKHFTELFVGMDNVYMQARAADIRDVSKKILDVLQRKSQFIKTLDRPGILLAEELLPSELMQIDCGKILALVFQNETAYSHTAILAKAMDIPTISGIELQKSWEGQIAIVDGTSGEIIINPSDTILAKYMEKKEFEEVAERKKQQLVQEFKKTDRVKIYANVVQLAEIDKVLENQAEGIGLFRSEYLFLGRETCPTEEEQFQVYKTIAEKMQGKEVIIRTMDAGSDKKINYLEIEQEENPALGYRGIRISLEKTEIFKAQLRAIYRASVFGTISVMFPMIVSVKEVQEIKRICKEVQRELLSKKIAYKEIRMGIMIETPAAVVISDILAQEVDFLSIGTNDLMQFTFAADRQNPKLQHIYEDSQLAMFRMIQTVIDNGHQYGCDVGICGELAADVSLTKKFVDMGIDKLSVAPVFIPAIKKNDT